MNILQKVKKSHPFPLFFSLCPFSCNLKEKKCNVKVHCVMSQWCEE
jgi:hypothetical protein